MLRTLLVGGLVLGLAACTDPYYGGGYYGGGYGPAYSSGYGYGYRQPRPSYGYVQPNYGWGGGGYYGGGYAQAAPRPPVRDVIPIPGTVQSAVPLNREQSRLAGQLLRDMPRVAPQHYAPPPQPRASFGGAPAWARDPARGNSLVGPEPAAGN
jgi:hypothetical protein